MHVFFPVFLFGKPFACLRLADDTYQPANSSPMKVWIATAVNTRGASFPSAPLPENKNPVHASGWRRVHLAFNLSCPGSDLSCIRPVLYPSYPASDLSSSCPVLYLTCPASVLYLSCPASILSFIRAVRHLSCPSSFLSCINCPASVL